MESATRILVVDDDAFCRDILARFLRKFGYHVEGVRDGLEALSYLRTNERPHLILLDLRMQGLDGRQFRQEQRQDPRLADIPIVVFSGVAGIPANTVGIDAAAYFEKPCDLDKLLAAIQRLTRNPDLVAHGAVT